MLVVAICKSKGRDIVVLRDNQGKWYIKVDDITTQSRLNASELARWFCEAMNDT